jgi:putative endonuclease
MASVYILYSKKSDKFYIGSTKELQTRIFYHKTKEFKGSFTSNYEDWELFFSIDNLKISVARKIENHIKKQKSKTYIENLKSYPEISEKLIIKYS